MTPWSPAPARLPFGQRVYAVGDVHGCASRLAILHARIAEDMAERPIGLATLIHLGDYVDRGPDSATVIAMLARGSPVAGVRMVNLRGNHEDMMLAALTSLDAEAASLWVGNGGLESLLSWGVPPTAKLSRWASHIPLAHISYLQGLTLTHREGPYLFVHAGVRPGLPIDAQSPSDLLWIREPFLSWPGDFGAVVVHGHTPFPEPVIRRNRVGIDTGAVIGGSLTCAVLEGDRVAFLTA